MSLVGRDGVEGGGWLGGLVGDDVAAVVDGQAAVVGGLGGVGVVGLLWLLLRLTGLL